MTKTTSLPKGTKSLPWVLQVLLLLLGTASFGQSITPQSVNSGGQKCHKQMAH
jgi:hypothetical protein